MQAIGYTSDSSSGKLKLIDVPSPQPRGDELLIKVRAFGINRADLLQKQGKYPVPEGESSILGLEVAGDVIWAPSDCSGFSKGDRVFGLVGGGAYAELCCLPIEMAIKIPKEMGYAEAAAIPEVFFTARETLFSCGNLKSGEGVLIHAAGSGVGTAAVQLAKRAGAHVYATAGSPDKLEKLQLLGADHTYNYRERDLIHDILPELKGKIDLIHDPLGGRFLSSHLDLLNEKGRLVHFAMLEGRALEGDLSQLIFKRLSLHGFVLRRQTRQEKIMITQRFIKNDLHRFADRSLKAVVDSTFQWDKINEAHELLERRLNFGKVIGLV